jgi:glycosyltransferase involved in cell wall biosynthesis
VELRDVPAWGPARLAPDAQDPLFAWLERPVDCAQTVLQFCLPHMVLHHPGKLNVNFTMFETTGVPAAWVAENRKHDLVIVPTESSRDAWLGRGMPAHRIRICPLGVDTEAFSGAAEPLPLRMEDGTPIASYRTRFLNVAEVAGRKNLAGLLEAWMEATSRRDDAVLMVKVGCYKPGAWDSLGEQIERLEQRTGKSLADAAPVAFLRGAVADAEMPRLYAAATHYISLSFGEGWDLPMTEAAASGLKLIAPEHSAYRAYLDSSIARMIPVHQVPARDTGDPHLTALYEGSYWWEPDRACAVEAIRGAVEGRDSHFGSTRERMAGGFTWAHAARRLTAILDELESLRAKLPPFAALRSNRGAATGRTRSKPDAPPTPNPS